MESQGRRNLGLAEQFLQGAWLPFFASPDALTQVVSSLIHCIWGSLCSNSRGFITGATALLHSSTFSSDVNKVTVPSFQMKKHRLGGLNDFFQGQKHSATFKTAGLFHANAHPLHCSVHYRSFCKSSHSDSDFSALLSLTYPEQVYYHLKMKGYQLYLLCSSVQFSHSVLSNSLRPHESQHASPPCPSPTPGVHSDPRPLSPWCHPAISSSVVPFSSCPQALPASESFPISHSSHEVAKVLEFQLQHQSFQRNPRADLLQNGLVGSPPLKNLLQHHSSKASILRHSAFFTVQLSHHTWPLEKP